MSLLQRLRSMIGQFRHDADGVAAVEFALVVPVMLLLYVGSVEASSVISVDRRVQTVAASMGDLVSRSNVKIAGCDIKDFFQASAGIMAPYSSTPLQQVVSSIFVDAVGKTEVKWSKSTGGATALTVGAEYPLPSAMKNISLNAFVIVATASYSYMPITGIVYNQPIQLRRENFYLPRFGGSIVVDPDNTTGC
ncbi:MAG: pilus assembly protein [Devosia sp.]|uniref:TadE/TadG family type IV pilus assembly protein n=1 Tax=Devosia sp. TaxID=1871048 RepID=UPI002633D9A7|nr:TadE/TadG family type IV pilus assembly protein [Devosia sp.]MDB5528308.1 pilus assembly protein [Devosia sp.]